MSDMHNEAGPPLTLEALQSALDEWEVLVGMRDQQYVYIVATSKIEADQLNASDPSLGFEDYGDAVRQLQLIKKPGYGVVSNYKVFAVVKLERLTGL